MFEKSTLYITAFYIRHVLGRQTILGLCSNVLIYNNYFLFCCNNRNQFLALVSYLQAELEVCKKKLPRQLC